MMWSPSGMAHGKIDNIIGAIIEDNAVSVGDLGKVFLKCQGFTRLPVDDAAVFGGEELLVIGRIEVGVTGVGVGDIAKMLGEQIIGDSGPPVKNRHAVGGGGGRRRADFARPID